MSRKKFTHDVFVSYSSKDREIVIPIAEKLKESGLNVWIDIWSIKPGDNIYSSIEDGLENSRVLILCMSGNAFSSEWSKLETGTFRFRDPLNKGRRFIPIRLDDAPIKGSLEQILYIDWRSQTRESSFAKLLEACQPPQKDEEWDAIQAAPKPKSDRAFKLKFKKDSIWSYSFNRDDKKALISSDNSQIELWDLKTKSRERVYVGHSDTVNKVIWSLDNKFLVSSSHDETIRIWDAKNGRCIDTMHGHSSIVDSVSILQDQKRIVSCSQDETIRLWEISSGRCLKKLKTNVFALAVASCATHIGSGHYDGSIRIWNIETGNCEKVLEGHTDTIDVVSWSEDGRYIASGSGDTTVRVWDVDTGLCVKVLYGHKARVWDLAWGRNDHYIVSGSDDHSSIMWEVSTGLPLCILQSDSKVRGVHCSSITNAVYVGDGNGLLKLWDVSQFIQAIEKKEEIELKVPHDGSQVKYTNAKVVLVGESSAGKTGLSKVLAGEQWEPTDSTVGAWATHWNIQASTKDDLEREVWIWDFGGQADQRLIHQLYMDDTAVAVLVFDGQKENLFEILAQWDREITRASSTKFTKLLAAGRVDAGRLRVSRNQIEAFKSEKNYIDFIETSAKTGEGCDQLKKAILAGIQWNEIPWSSSSHLFKRLKEEIIKLKDSGRVLIRMNELRDLLKLRLPNEFSAFDDAELSGVVNLLKGPGVVWVLNFGGWLLLQPEMINAYAQAVIQTMRQDELEIGSISEEKVLKGDLFYHSSHKRLPSNDEIFVLLAMHQQLVEKGICIREQTEKGPFLIFPSYYRRERPELPGHPAALLSYKFTGFLDEIYATLVVRLHHTKPFEKDELWRYAADFKTTTGKSLKLGVKLSRFSDGVGELTVYSDPRISVEEKILFSRYVHEHLTHSAKDVQRTRHYTCSHCHTPVGNHEIAMKRLNEWVEAHAERRLTKLPTIICVGCEKRIELWDDIEKNFASDETRIRVRNLQKQSAFVLDNESKERALVGDVISTVALAGHISREHTVSDYGIDMEVEFKDEFGNPTGRKVYLQLKSGDSHLTRRVDGTTYFSVSKRHAEYWSNQAFPVILIIRFSDGRIVWMEIRDYLNQASASARKTITKIEFDGKKFDVMSVLEWRNM
ncbi:MAG: TIR domain-containing protein [Ferrovibrio sp.]